MPISDCYISRLGASAETLTVGQFSLAPIAAKTNVGLSAGSILIFNKMRLQSVEPHAAKANVIRAELLKYSMLQTFNGVKSDVVLAASVDTKNSSLQLTYALDLNLAIAIKTTANAQALDPRVFLRTTSIIVDPKASVSGGIQREQFLSSPSNLMALAVSFSGVSSFILAITKAQTCVAKCTVNPVSLFGSLVSDDIASKLNTGFNSNGLLVKAKLANASVSASCATQAETISVGKFNTDVVAAKCSASAGLITVPIVYGAKTLNIAGRLLTEELEGKGTDLTVTYGLGTGLFVSALSKANSSKINLNIGLFANTAGSGVSSALSSRSINLIGPIQLGNASTAQAKLNSESQTLLKLMGLGQIAATAETEASLSFGRAILSTGTEKVSVAATVTGVFESEVLTSAVSIFALAASGQIGVKYPLLATSATAKLNSSAQDINAKVALTAAIAPSLSLVGYLSESALLPSRIVLKSTSEAGFLRVPWVETKVSVASSLSVIPIKNSDFIVSPRIVLADAGSLSVYVTASQNASTLTLGISNFTLEPSSVSMKAALNASRLEIPLRTDAANASASCSNAVVSLKPLRLATDALTFVKVSLSLAAQLEGNTFLGTAFAAAKLDAYSFPVRFNPLSLGQVIVAASANSAPIPNDKLVITGVRQLPAPTAIQCKSAVTGYFATDIASIDYPVTVHEQVRYPIGTASSYASPLINDVPVFYSHGVFGAAITNVDPGSVGSASLSALLRTELALNVGDSYSSNSVQASSMLVLFRISAADTSTVVRSAFGASGIGADLTRFSSSSAGMPIGYTGSVTQIGTGGTTLLASGNQFVDGRSMNTSSQNGRFFIASALVRHNYKSADSTTVPLSAATDFNYPTTNITRLSRARLETTVKADDEVGLSPVYSTVHMGMISDSDFQSRYSSGAPFSLNAASVGSTTAAATQHIHSSDSMFAFIPIKAGVRYQFNKNYAPLAGSYTVASAEFINVSGQFKFVVSLVSSTGAPVNSNSIPGNLKLRIKVNSYRADDNRSVLVDIPIVDRYNNDFVVDSAYRWFVQSVLPVTGVFYDQAEITLARDEAYATWSTAANATLIVTRPNTLVSALPASEQGGGDQGESAQYLLSATDDRNLIMGEFSLGISRNSSAVEASARVSTSPTNSTETYDAGDPANTPANSVSAADPDVLQLIIDQAGNLKGSVRRYVNGQYTTTSDLNSILPNAVKVFIKANGKFSKVVVGQNNVGLLTVPTAGNSGRKLFLWGTNVYGQLIPPDDINANTYETFLREGYINNVLDFDIGLAYVCIISDTGSLRCWGCNKAIQFEYLPESPWVSTAANKIEQSAIGGRHMVLKTASPTPGISRIRQYGNLAQNAPYLDGWASDPAITTSYDFKLVACGAEHAVAIRADGSIACWGDNTQGQCAVPAALAAETVVEVAAGDYHTVALDSKGNVYAWGRNAEGQTNIGSVSGLKAKSIFAAGNYSGAIRRATATDVTATPGIVYSDVEDTVLITGDNSRYVANVPLCEGLSYDPLYPRCRMKFHKVIAGWDHVIGIRKVESDLAHVIHPELCRFVNNDNILVRFVTSANALIFPDVASANVLFGDADANGSTYYPNQTGTSVGTVSYRIKQVSETDGGQAFCSSGRIIQRKPAAGSWADVKFRITSYDSYGTIISTNDEVTGINLIKPVWFGATNALPYWAVGLNQSGICGGSYQYDHNILSASQAVGATGEKLDLNFAAADAYLNSNTDESIVCWGNPIAYYTGYVKNDYVNNYGVPSSNLEGSVNDVQAIEPYITQDAANPRFVAVANNSFSKIADYYPVNQTCSYVGRLSFANAINTALIAGNTVYGPLVPDTSTGDLYLGPVSAYLIPSGQSFGGLYTPMIVRTSLVSNTNSEDCILNAILPVEGYKGTTPPATNAFYSWYNSPVDSNIGLKSSLGIAQGAIKALLPPSSATLLQTNYVSTQKWVVMADTDPLLSSYGWGISPTGFWYVYNNNSSSTGGVTAGLQARYYNLTGICAYTYNADDDAALDEARLPYESSLYNVLTSAQLAAIGLGIRRFHVVKHMTDKSWSMTQPKLMVKAGKHISMLPITPTATTTITPNGVLIKSNDEQSSVLGWLPMSSSEFGVAFFDVGYRSIYALQKQDLLLYTSNVFFSLLEASPQGDNLYGQLTTPEYYSKFTRQPAFGPASGTTVPVYSNTWLMNVGQLTPPAVAAGQTFTKVSCGQYHALAIDTRGKVYAWGSNSRMTGSVLSVSDWNPSMCRSWNTPCNPPQQWYSATKDIFEFTPPANPDWWTNYVSGWGGVPASLRQEAPYFLPYPVSLSTGQEAGTYNSNSATLWSGGDIGPVSFSQAGFKGTYTGSSFTNFRNGGFSISVVQDANGKRFELSTGLNEPKLYSSYFNTGSVGLRLLSWAYTYDGGLKFTARVNGSPITWGPNPEDLVSPALTTRSPSNATQVIGTSEIPNPKLEDTSGLVIEGVVAGRNFAGIVHSSSISGYPSKYLLQRNNGSTINYIVEAKGFEDISIGSFSGFTDLVLQKVIRRFNVIGNSTYSGGSIYSGSVPTIAKYFETPYKIYIGDEISLDTPVKYTDIIPPAGGYLIWPQVVFPGDANYTSPYAYNPKDIGLFRYPNIAYSDTDTFSIVSIRDREANPQPPLDGQVFDIDQTPMYYSGGDLLGQYVVYDASTKRLLPQRYTPNANSTPAAVCTDVMAWANTGFAVSANKLHSWGKNRDKARSYNDTSYDVQSALIPSGITSITCPAKSNTFFKGAVLVGNSPSSTMFVWGAYSEYNQYWSLIAAAAGNKVHIDFTFAQGSTPLQGFKKIVVADVFTFANTNWFYGIDSANKIKFFKVAATAIADSPDIFNPERYLKYVEYDPNDPIQQADFVSDYAVPAEVASLNIADVEMAPNAVVVRTTDGKVFCWGQTGGYADIAYNFNDQCHECAADYSASTEATAANPSPKTKLNSTSSTNPVVDIAVSESHAAALRSDGSVLIWGINSPYTIAGGYASQLQQNNPFKTATPTNKPRKMGSNKQAMAAIRNDGEVQVWLNDSFDSYGLIPATTINLGGYTNAKLTKNSSAFNFIALNNSGGLTAWGAGEIGAQGDPNYGQSAIPRNLFESSPWDTSNAQYRQSAVVTPVAANGSNSTKMMVTHKDVSANLTIPTNIKAVSDSNPVTATDIQSFVNVVDIAAGKNVMFAITNATYGATSGSIVKWGVNSVTVPAGSNWSKIASSHTQTQAVAWSHAAAIDSSGNLRLWGVDPYWTANQSPAGSYKAITCTNHAVIATRSDNTLAVFEKLPDGSTTASVSLPPYLQNVAFKQVSGGENHVVATVLSPASISTPNGLFELNTNDVVAWGDNSSQQCNIPGYAYASPDNLPIQSDYIAAGYDFSLYNRIATGITHPVLGNFALAFQSGYDSSIERAEGYMVHSTGSLCDFILPESHEYYFNRPTFDLERPGINGNTGHKAQSGWTTNATTVPADFLPTSASPRKAKLVCADRFKAWTRTGSTRDYQWGAGYSVIVEDGNTDSIVVFGGEQLLSGCPTPFVTPGSIAIRQIPVLENGTKISAIQSHRGYLYALDSSGTISSWGYIGSSTNYFSLSNDSFSLFKRSLSIPRTALTDADVKYSSAGGTTIAASYVTGVPDLSPSWAVDVSINRYYNGQKTILKRYAATGSTDKVDISQGVNFAQGFMALDSWPGFASSLDTYYTLDISLAGGGVRYKVNSASLMAMNLDSKNSVGAKILKEATSSTDQGVADFAVVANTKYLAGRVPAQAGTVGFDSVLESQSGFTIDYNTDVNYPAYLRNSFGSSAKIELIDTANQNLFLQGRIAETTQGIGWMDFLQNWATAGITPQAGGSTTPITSWNSTTQSSLTPLTTGGILAPYLVNTFTTGKLGIKLRSQSVATASRLLNSNPNVVMGAFTYFVVKRNVSDTTAATSPNTPYLPHSIFSAIQRIGTSAYAQGIGENGRKPAVVFTDNNTVFFHQTSAQSITVNAVQIINAYFGSASDLGIRLNGSDQALAANATAVTMTTNLQNGYYLGAPLFTTGVREQNTEIAEVIVFNRRLSLAEIEFVEGYLAWAFGVQASLPPTHPYSNSAPVRGQLTAIKPFADDAGPDQFFDVGLAASNRAETWLTLYDVTAEYRSSRINAGGLKDDHAPLIVELELDKQESRSLLTVTTAMKCQTNAAILEITGQGRLSFGSAFGKLAVVNIPDTFTVRRNDALGVVPAENKLAVSAALTFSAFNLQTNALNLNLKFMAGVNCDGPYGCTDVEDRAPDLTIISNIPKYNPVLIDTRFRIFDAALGVNLKFRYIKSDCVFSCFGSLNLISSISGSVAARLQASASSLKFVYENLTSTAGSIVQIRANVRICDATGFIIKKPKYTKPPPPIFPTVDRPGSIASGEINFGGNSFEG